MEAINNADKALDAAMKASKSDAQNAGLIDKFWKSETIIRKLISRLREVDTSGCPSDYQSSFLSLIQVHERAAQLVERNSGFSGLFRNAIISFSGRALINIVELRKADEKLSDDYLQAWQNLEQADLAQRNKARELDRELKSRIEQFKSVQSQLKEQLKQ